MIFSTWYKVHMDIGNLSLKEPLDSKCQEYKGILSL